MKTNHRIFLIILTAAFLTMGISMPSCPGTQELQNKVDALGEKDVKLEALVRSLETQIKSINTEITTLKTTSEPAFKKMTELETQVKETKTNLDLLKADLAKLAAPAPKGKKAKKF